MHALGDGRRVQRHAEQDQGGGGVLQPIAHGAAFAVAGVVVDEEGVLLHRQGAAEVGTLVGQQGAYVPGYVMGNGLSRGAVAGHGHMDVFQQQVRGIRRRHQHGVVHQVAVAGGLEGRCPAAIGGAGQTRGGVMRGGFLQVERVGQVLEAFEIADDGVVVQHGGRGLHRAFGRAVVPDGEADVELLPAIVNGVGDACQSLWLRQPPAVHIDALDGKRIAIAIKGLHGSGQPAVVHHAIDAGDDAWQGEDQRGIAGHGRHEDLHFQAVIALVAQIEVDRDACLGEQAGVQGAGQ